MTSALPSRQRIVIRNTVPRRDASGRIIDCHDGRVIRFGERFYWYGTSYGNTDGFGTSNRYVAYSSTDLTNWTQESTDLIPGAPTGVYYRPHVVFHAPTARYVLWYNWYPSLWIGRYGVAIAGAPAGPFTIVATDVAMAYGAETGGSLGDAATNTSSSPATAKDIWRTPRSSVTASPWSG